MNLAACIFDLDGTVVLDEHLYANAFRRVLKSLGVVEKRKSFHRGGIGVEENWQEFIKSYDLNTKKSAKQLARDTNQEYLKRLDDVKLNPGFSGFAEDLKSRGVLTALATSSVWEIADAVVQKLKLGDYFECITTGDGVGRKKPHPEIFVITAQKLGVEPAHCIVFEDSGAGVTAAHEAGMKVVGIERDKIQRKDIGSAELIIKTFNDVSFGDLSKIN